MIVVWTSMSWGLSVSIPVLEEQEWRVGHLAPAWLLSQEHLVGHSKLMLLA